MPGFSPSKPGAMPALPAPPDNVAQGEFGQDELKTLSAPYVADMSDKIYKPDPDQTEQATTILRNLRANDPHNIMKDQLEGVKKHKADDKGKYDAAVMRQLLSKSDKIPPSDPNQGELKLIFPEKGARQPFSNEQVLSVTAKLLNKDMSQAMLARNYSSLNKKLQEKTQDFHLARTNVYEWVEKNAVPDTTIALQELERLNRAARNRGERPMDYPAYKEMLKQQMHENIKRVGQEEFYNSLRRDLQVTKDAFEKSHQVIQDNLGE